MARSLNKVTLIGNVGNDPEIRTTQTQIKNATFSLATSKQWNDGRGEKKEKTEWHRCVAWNAGNFTLADIVEAYVKKGSKVYVEGEIEYRQWQEKEGQTRYSTEIKVRELILLGAKGEGGDAGSGSPTRTKAPASSDDRPSALAEEDDDLPF